MSDLTLWKLDASPPARAVMTLADILGLKLKYIDLDFFANEHKSPEYMKINPIGTVPTLKDGEFILTDSHAIMKYLLEKYGGEQRERLYPNDLRKRALVDQALFFDTGVYFIKIKHVALPAVFGNSAGPTEKDIEEINNCYNVLESWLGDKSYIAGDLSIADISLGVTTSVLQCVHKLDDKRYPRTYSWLNRLKELPPFKEHADISTNLMGQVLESCWEKNKKL